MYDTREAMVKSSGVVSRILVVDDEEQIRKLIKKSIINYGWDCVTAPDAEEALEILSVKPVDVVITDIQMSGMNGIELNRIVKERFDTDVIIMTGYVDAYTYDRVVEEGASDFLQKPLHMKELMLRLKRVLRERSVLAERNQVEVALKNSLDKLKRTLNGIVSAMALTLEARDPYTAGHQRRVADLACAIARKMNLSADQVDQINMAGVIHDLGKIAVPAEILAKPTRLTEFEFGIVKTHPKVGFDLLKTIEFPWPIAQIVYQHHEKMDGSGYPLGLKGDDILLEARLITIADVVEAIASHRPYRPSLGVEIAIEEISRNRGAVYYAPAVDACIEVIRGGYNL